MTIYIGYREKDTFIPVLKRKERIVDILSTAVSLDFPQSISYEYFGILPRTQRTRKTRYQNNNGFPVNLSIWNNYAGLFYHSMIQSAPSKGSECDDLFGEQTEIRKLNLPYYIEWRQPQMSNVSLCLYISSLSHQYIIALPSKFTVLPT